MQEQLQILLADFPGDTVLVAGIRASYAVSQRGSSPANINSVPSLEMRCPVSLGLFDANLPLAPSRCRSPGTEC